MYHILPYFGQHDKNIQIDITVLYGIDLLFNIPTKNRQSTHR